MSSYLKPLNINEKFNVADFNYQDTYITYTTGDNRYFLKDEDIRQSNNIFCDENSIIGNNAIIGGQLTVADKMIIGKTLTCAGDVQIFGNVQYSNQIAGSIFIQGFTNLMITQSILDTTNCYTNLNLYIFLTTTATNITLFVEQTCSTG